MQAGRTYFLIALTVGSGILAALLLWPFFTPLMFAIITAVLLYPLHQWITPRFMRPSLSALLLVLGTFLALCTLFFSVGLSVWQQAESTYQSIESGSIISGLQILFQKSPVLREFFANNFEFIGSWTRTLFEWIASRLSAIASSLVSLGFSYFVYFLSLFYLIRDGAHFVESALAVGPLTERERALLRKRLGEGINGTIRGNIIVALLQGIAATTGYLLFGVENAFFWGTLTAISSLLPIVGPPFIYVPIAIYVYFTAGLVPAVLLFIYATGIMLVINNILGPRIVGHRVHLHPLVVFFAALGGIGLFGIVGIVLGPLVFVLLFSFIYILNEIRREARTHPSIHKEHS